MPPGAQEGDFLLASKMLELPPAGMLGAFLSNEAGGVSVESFGGGSATERAGIQKGDRIVELEGKPVSDFAGVKMGLRDKCPGDTVSVKVERAAADGSGETLRYDVTLR